MVTGAGWPAAVAAVRAPALAVVAPSSGPPAPAAACNDSMQTQLEGMMGVMQSIAADLGAMNKVLSKLDKRVSDLELEELTDADMDEPTRKRRTAA